MTIASDHDLAVLDYASDSSPMTLETARSLAAILAPHLAAMRAVTVGTIADIGVEVASEPDSSEPQPVVSPTTMIFIAGMLERLSPQSAATA